jgi:YVTN family beta-propeller protein
MRSPSSSPPALFVAMLLCACAKSERSDLGRDASTTSSPPPHDENVVQPNSTHPSGKVFAALRSSGRPFGIAVSINDIVYCTLLDAARLVRTTSGADSLTPVDVSDVPTDVAFSPAGNWAYVTNQGARTVGVVDTRTHTQVDAIPVPGDPFRVVVGPEGLRVYATTNTGNLVQIDTETRTVAWTRGLGGNLNGLAINASGTRIYVGDVGGRVYELDAAGEVIRTLILPGMPQGLALSSDGKELYVAGEAGEFVVADLERGSESARIRLGAGGFGIALTPDEAQIWITLPTAGQVLVVDRASRTRVAELALGGTPRRLAFNRSGDTAIIADEAGAIHLVR